jgi:DNA modification methylase
MPEPQLLGPEYRNYVTAQLPRKQPIYNWFVFPHSFSKELVHWLIERFNIPEGGLVCDTFVGAGTTILACKERGINAWGYDLLPLSVMVTNTKVANYRLTSLRALWERIDSDVSQEAPAIDIPLINRAFSPAVRNRLHGILNQIQEIVPDGPDRNFFHLALLSILERVSYTRKDGGWLKILETENDDAIRDDDVSHLFQERVAAMLNDVEATNITPAANRSWGAQERDARSFSRSMQADAIITSPPYLNRHDYTRVFALELTSGFVESHNQIRDFRYRALRSHPEAHAPEQWSARGYNEPQELRDAKAQLPTTGRNCDSRVHRMIDGYFQDMFLVLRAARRQVRSGGHIAFIIGNVRFGGVSIPVDSIIGDIGESLGLRCTDILIARERGNSAQQMRDHGRAAARESIVVWQRP